MSDEPTATSLEKPDFDAIKKSLEPYKWGDRQGAILIFTDENGVATVCGPFGDRPLFSMIAGGMLQALTAFDLQSILASVAQRTAAQVTPQQLADMQKRLLRGNKPV